MTPDNLWENLDKNRKTEWELSWLFVDKFVEEVKSSSYTKEKRNELIEKIWKWDSINVILPELQSFHSSLKEDNKEFVNFSLDKLNFFDIKRAFTKDFVKRKNTESNFISELTRTYDISEKYLSKAKKLLAKKSTKEIEAISKDTALTLDFLEKEVKIPQVQESDLSSILDWYSTLEIEKKLKKVQAKDREEVELALWRIAEWNYSELDFKTLFATWFFNRKEKKYFLNKYNSTISLRQAIDFSLISQRQAEKKKKEIVREIISKDESLIDLDKARLNLLIWELTLDDIKVDVLGLDLDEKKLDKFVLEWNWLSKLEKEIEDSKREMQENYLNKVPENFIAFKKFLETKYPNNVINISSFENGAYLKVTRKESDSKSYNKIYEIISKDNKKRWMSLKIVWSDSDEGVDINSSRESETYNYADIISLLENSSKEKWEFELDFISKQNFLEKLHSKNSSLKSSDYTSFTEKDLENKDLKNSYISDIEQEISDLEDEIVKLRKEDSSSEKIKDLEDLLYSKKIRLGNLYKNSSVSESLEALNFEKLVRDLDSLDSSWVKLWLKKWLFLEAEKWGLAEIYWIDAEKWEIIVKQAWEIIPLSFASFYASFKKHSLKRVEKIVDFWWLLDELKVSWVNIPDNYKFKNSEFVAEKEWADSKDKKVNFLVSKNWKEIVRLDSIDWDRVTITLWTREKEEDKKTKQEKEIHSMQKKSETLSLNEFKTWIVEREMFPDWTIWANPKDLEHKEDPIRKWSFGTRFLNRLSLSDLLFAGKMFVDNFQETLKRGSEASSAKLALKMWKFLPDDLRHNLQIKVEWFDKEERDKELDKLDKIDSWDAAKKIKKWLKNRDTADYKIEAAMLFMLQKYGHLTAKWKDDDSLFEFRWKFMWYQALWWRIWDKLYNEELERARAAWNTFSEEWLVYSLVARQCKNAGWYNWKKRSSKLYKEVEWKAWAGIEAEIKKWYDDATKKNHIGDIVDFWMWELFWGTTANSVWVFKRALEKWWSLEEMSEWFFVLLYSWALYEVDGNILNNIKNLIDGDKIPMILVSACRNVKSMNIAREAILEISKKIWEEYPDKHWWIYKQALEIFNNATWSFTWNPKEKVEKTLKFYKEHWKPIMRAMNMANTDDTTYSKTDKVVLFEKDTNPALKRYYNHIKTFTATEFNSFGKWSMEDAFWEAWVTGLNIRSVTEQWLKLYTSKSFKDQDIAAKVWKEFHSDIVSTKDKLFVWDDISSVENKIYQRKYLKSFFRELLSGMRANHTWALLQDYDVVGDMSTSMKAWWISPVGRLEEYSPSDIAEWKADGIIDNAIWVILWEKWEYSSNNDNRDILREENLVKDRTENTLDKKAKDTANNSWINRFFDFDDDWWDSSDWGGD